MPGEQRNFLRRGGVLPTASLAGAALAVVFAAGCQDTNRAPRGQFGTSTSREEMNTQNLNYAFEVLHDSQDSQSGDVLAVVVDRLNQWIQQRPPIEDFTADKLLETLPEELRALPAVRNLRLARFPTSDGPELQQNVWLCEIAKRARGENSDALAIATGLFDWVIRNVQLERDGTIELPHMPREILLLGRGTMIDRAWIFSLLGRQQGLDIVMLALPGKGGEESRPWLPALFLDGELYLFDVRLGLPIPGPGGKPVATLNDILADEQLLRNLDVDEQRLYPVKGEDLAQVEALVEGSPLYLAARMAAVEEQLPGKETMRLTAHPAQVAERVAKHGHIAGVKLWKLPYERLQGMAKIDAEAQKKFAAEFLAFQQPPLLRGRMLHLLGLFEGEKGCNAIYQGARPSEQDLKALVDRTPEQDRPRVNAELVRIHAAKQCSSYWLGLVAFERGNYPAAVDYLKTRTLAATPDGPWTPGARYNLGRALEAQGEIDEAIGFYRADLSAQRNGNLLRARRLEEAQKKGAAAPAPAAG